MAIPESARATYERILQNIERVITGQRRAVRLLLSALASAGHVLLEDVPGTGKTTLAKALARSIEAHFHRIQFTPDLLPSDIIGITVYRPQDQSFQLHRGPVFTQILLADEINRASPRTQSALLEAMAENQVSIDGARHPLDPLFFVIATQNPIESHGTYPLPEAQMDRFALCFRLGYVALGEEVEILSAQTEQHPLERIGACTRVEEVLELQRAARAVRVSTPIQRYIVELVAATRQAQGVRLGASPRASLALMKTAQALALFDGLEYVAPEQVHEAARPVLGHRLVLEPQTLFSGMTREAVLDEILSRVPVPR